MKRIVVCCDGTWNDDDIQIDDTNVARLARAVHGSVGIGQASFQVVLYLKGVGSGTLRIEALVEGATGFGVDGNIRSAYQFIAQNYVPGDEIFLFGFSRGAFTARSLAGLVTACGILKRQSLRLLPDAWAYYRSDKPHSPSLFRKASGADVHEVAEIKFLGVWDTVGSLGIPGNLMSAANKEKYAFHDTTPSPIVRTAVHAMAVDEHRHDFVPTYWTGTVPQGGTIEQVWFAGAHADVGGGYKTYELANIPLVWMARRAESAGLSLDWTCLPSGALDPMAPAHDSASGLFALDRFRPTLREIGGRACATAFNECLYVAQDDAGRPLKPINEAVHRSVVERYGKPARVCTNDAKGTCSSSPYIPKTLQPFFGPGGFVGLPVVD